MMKKKDLSPRVARWILKLQEYDFDVIHRPGETMKHVDALSRSPYEVPQVTETVSLDVLNIKPENFDWLLTMQLQDTKIAEIKNTLTRKPNTNEERQVHKDFIFKQNALFRVIDNKLKWVVPKEIVWRVIKSSHDEMGHYGIEKTLEIIKRHYWFSKMRKKVTNYIKSCVECCYYKTKSGKREGELHNIERIPIPFHTVNIDHLGPFPRSSKGYTHILVYVDNFTKYSYLESVRDTSTKNVIKTLETIFSIFGPPKRLISDRGTAFTSKQFQNFCNDHDIAHIKTAVATPRANGQVERFNKTITNAVTTTCQKPDGKDWDVKLKLIQYAMNSVKNKTTKETPHDLLFGFQPRNVFKNKLVLALEDEDMLDRTLLRLQALVLIEKQQGKQKEYFDKHRRTPTKYNVGDLVLIQREPVSTGEPRKLKPHFKGPYQIVETFPNDRYRIVDIEGAENSQRKFSQIYAAHHLKGWCIPYDPSEVEDDYMSSEAECDN